MAFIKIDRCILDSYCFANPNHLKIWLWLLVKANFKKTFASLKIGKGYITVDVNRGQLLFGRHKAEEELNINGSTIYRCLQKFEELGQIILESNNQYTLITVCKYDTYQDKNEKEEQPKNKLRTTKEQTTDNQQTASEQHKNTSKESKEDKEDNIKDIKTRMKYFAENVASYQNEYSKEMLQEFYDYWREPEITQKKMLWELNKTWDLNLRLKRWKRNDDNKKPQPKKIDWQVEKFNFLNDDTWRMRIAQEYRASKEQFDRCISCFIKDIEDKDDYKDVAGLKRHFINHIKKNGVNCKKELQPTSSISSSHIPNYDTPEKLAALLDKYK